MKHTSQRLGLSHLQNFIIAKHQWKNFGLILLNYTHRVISGKQLIVRDSRNLGPDTWTVKQVLLDLYFSMYQPMGSYGRSGKGALLSLLPSRLILWRSAGSSLVCQCCDLPCTRVDTLDTAQAHIFYPNDTISYTKQIFWVLCTSVLRAWL